MMSKRQIIAYILEEMPESYKKEAVVDYINAITKEITVRQEQDREIKLSREARARNLYRSQKQKQRHER